jgi:hypothetical protein
MLKKLPEVNCRYGAPMGRGESHCIGAENIKFRLQRVRIDSGGYDSGGAYWGLGTPLYWYQSTDGSIEGFLRARTREVAKAEIRNDYPSARFFR